jgi:hypothetical protein
MINWEEAVSVRKANLYAEEVSISVRINHCPFIFNLPPSGCQISLRNGTLSSVHCWSLILSIWTLKQ